MHKIKAKYVYLKKRASYYLKQIDWFFFAILNENVGLWAVRRRVYDNFSPNCVMNAHAATPLAHIGRFCYPYRKRIVSNTLCLYKINPFANGAEQSFSLHLNFSVQIISAEFSARIFSTISNMKSFSVGAHNNPSNKFKYRLLSTSRNLNHAFKCMRCMHIYAYSSPMQTSCALRWTVRTDV